jgi:S1-C subfamily serine protease
MPTWSGICPGRMGSSQDSSTAGLEVTVSSKVESWVDMVDMVDTQGHILTNYHVIQDATRVLVKLSDGRTLEARVAGTSPADDIALLSVDPQAVAGIAPLLLGDSSSVTSGQMAIVMGSPFGLANSITVGVVSGV